jgi:hypothetical protein
MADRVQGQLGVARAVAAALGAAALFAAAAPAQAQSGAPLTESTLKALLQQGGLEPKPLTHGFLVVIKAADWTENVQLVISPNGRKLGFNANLGQVNAAEVTAPQWMALRAANSDIDPNFFYYDPTAGKLYLHRSVDNRGVTQASLQEDLISFGRAIITTEKLWAFTH